MIRLFAIAAIAAMAASSASAQICPPGYGARGGVCQPLSPPSYSNPVSGAVTGEAQGAARGNAAAGPVGAIVGGAIGTATGAVNGAVNMLSPTPPPQHVCGPGYTLYNDYCYPAR